MNDGDWICNEQNCGNINFARRTSCYRCNAEKPETEKTSKKKLGTEIGKSAAEKSRGLFNADDWQCNKCANVNWARRTTCNVCNAPKFGEVEARTGYGGGYNERGVVEYRRREGSSDDEYDEFGRKKRKQQRTESDDKVGITEGAEFKNLLPKPQMELKVRNCMPATADETKALVEHNLIQNRLSDEKICSNSRHPVREYEPRYQSASYKNFKYMNSNRANSYYQNRQNRKRYTSNGDREHTGSSGYETGTKKARKDSSDSPVFMSFDPVMENMVTSTNEVVYKFNGPNPSSNFEVTYTTKERIIAAAFAIAYNNCKISSDRFESLFDKPSPDFKTIFAWRQRLLATGCLDDSHLEIKTATLNQVKPVKVPNPDEIAILSSESEDENIKDQLQNNSVQLNKPPPQVQSQRSESVETVLLERVETTTQGSKTAFESRNNKNTAASCKETQSSSSDSRNSDSSDSDSEQTDLKSKTSTRSSRPTITSARQSAIDSDSESVSYHSDEDNFLSRKFGETKKVRRKFKRRNTVAPLPSCSTPETPVNYVPQITQPQATVTNTIPYQGYSTVNTVEKSPLMTGNIYTPNLRNMIAKPPHPSAVMDNDGGSGEYVPTRLGAKNNYQDFKNNVRLNRPGYWARANGATLGNKRNNSMHGNNNLLGQQNKSPVKRCISTYVTATNQPNPIKTNVVMEKSMDNLNSAFLPGNSIKSPIKKHVSSYIPGIGDPCTRKRAISSFIPVEPPKSTIPGLEEPDKSPIKNLNFGSNPLSNDHVQKEYNSSIPDHHKALSIKQRRSSIPGFEPDNILSNYTTMSPLKNQLVQNNSFNTEVVDFTRDILDGLACDHYLTFDKPKTATPQHSQNSNSVSPYKQKQNADKCMQSVDQIPLPSPKKSEDTARVFAVIQENSASKNRSIMDIFGNGTEKSPERDNNQETDQNGKVHYETQWDEDDDALYGESGDTTFDDPHTSSPILKRTSIDNDPVLINQTDLLKEKKETLMGLLQNMQMDKESEQSYQKNTDRQFWNIDTFYSNPQSTDTPNLQKTVSNIRIIPKPPLPPDLPEEKTRLTAENNSNACDRSSIESYTSKMNENTLNIKNTKRIHVIESITLAPGTNPMPSKQHLELNLKPVSVISQVEKPVESESVEILVSSDEQEPTESPQASTQPPPSAAALPDLSNLLAGINANTLLLALQNLQQLASNSHNSSFNSTQNTEQDLLPPETAAQPVDTINLTNDDWEKESVGEGSIERQLEAMDGNPAATPFLSDIFDPSPVVQNVTRKLNINLKSPANTSDTQKPDENALVIGNFKSFALPKAPRLNRVKVPIKTSTKCTKRKGDGKKKRKKKKPAGSQDEAEAEEEDEEESGDEADLAKYDLWGSEDESSKTGSSSKTGGSSKAGTKSKEGESSKSEDQEDKNGKVDSPDSKNSRKSRSRSRSSSSSTSTSSSSSSGSQSSSQSASGSPKNKFDDFNLNSEREMSPRPRNSRSPRPRISAPLPRRKSHDSRGSNGDSRSNDSSRDKEWTREHERRGERARGSRSGDRKERRYSRDGGRHR